MEGRDMFFKNLWFNFYNTVVRAVDPKIKALILLVMFVGALVCFMFSIKKKDSIIISNWFLFYLAIVLTVLAVVYACLW
jgi:hypothetical protein